MGIKTLLPVLAPSTQQINIKDMKGTVVGIDASCWLHKGAFACAKELVLGLPTDSHVNFFMSCIDCLLHNDVTPVLVFDGPRTLPAKAAVAAERKRKRALAKPNAQTTTDPLKARTSYTAAVEITPAIVDRVIEASKEREVDYVVAPYEADAQLAFLSMNGAVQYIISEDSDLLVFGAKQVIYKYDKATGSGQLITQNNLHLSFKDFPDFSLEKFRMICILAGCDYLKSIFGIGPNMATAFVKALGDRNIFQEIYNLGAILGTERQYKVPDGYPDGLKKAMNTFKHQTVLHPDEGYVPLRPYPPGVSAVDMDYARLPLGDKPVFDPRKTWASVQMLNTTYQSDASFQYQDDSDEDRSSDSSQEPRHNLRSRPAQLATVIALGNTFKLTIPNFPVISLTLLHATVSVDGHLKPAVFRASDHRVLLYPTPFDIFIRDSCMMTVDDVEQ
ncbi:EXO1 [Branchiostoma lanceolatum]|uniref:Exonuclease 1 n=1 Tax=Branchiostoma lanceolatum TaxID=7740 RepID=A0A8K0E4Y3_BRALA|nr:EXO1 [Branchiostoma lanceolatum]